MSPVDGPDLLGNGAAAAPGVPEHEILELEFASALPAEFKGLLERFPIHRPALSNYREAMTALRPV